MRPELRCGVCTFRWTYERALLEGAGGEEFVLSLASLIDESLHEDVNLGVLNTEAVKKAYEFLHFTSPYFSTFKRISNRNAMDLLGRARKYIQEAKQEEDLLTRALRLACAANVSPVAGPRRPYTFEETLKVIEEEGAVNIEAKVLHTMLRAKRVLYVADNAGELAFDGLLIEVLAKMGKEIHLFVKKAPFFDDATREDVEALEIKDVLKSLHDMEGFFFPSSLDDAGRAVFSASDLIVSKGIGNYDAIGKEDLGRPVIHMFKVKCLPISRKVRGSIGELRVIMEG